MRLTGLLRSQIRQMTAAKFFEHQIIPDVVSNAPEHVLEVEYGDKKVKLGNVLTPTEVKDPPTQISWECRENSYYTLVMTDPDAPSRKTPTSREFQHWLVVNILGNNIATGQTLSEYIGSGPPKDTGLHRYVFLVYKQPDRFSGEIQPHIANTCATGRRNFQVEKFAKSHSLGHPVAGNFYQAQWDEYVPTIHQQLSGKST